MLAAGGASGVGLAAWALDPGVVHADILAFRARMNVIAAGRAIVEGAVTLQVPAISENGATVPVTVEVELSPAAGRHVKAIHLLSERNPEPDVATFLFSPRSGRAVASTRIRLAEGQRVHALAEMSDGTLFTASREVQVTVNGCGG